MISMTVGCLLMSLESFCDCLLLLDEFRVIFDNFRVEGK